MPFTFAKTEIPDVVLVTPKVFGDSRGFFEETYSKEAFLSAGIDATFVQDNHSYSTKGVLRGLHWQKPPYTQGKLVSVLIGEVFDVAVDIRKDSPTFGKWTGRVLSGENHSMLWIPPGFAHGFSVMSYEDHFLYKCTAPYNAASEASCLWNDPELNIDWKLTAEPLISEKDARAPLFSEITPL